MKGKILSIQDRKSHTCEFEIARGKNMGLCGKKVIALIDDQYFCADCVPDVLMRLPEMVLLDDIGRVIGTKRFIEECYE